MESKLDCNKCSSKRVVKGHKLNEWRCLDCGAIIIKEEEILTDEQKRILQDVEIKKSTIKNKYSRYGASKKL